MSDRKLRIALTVDPELPVPPSLYGGIERIVDLLARTLSARGHAITLFANEQSTCPVPLIPWTGTRSQSASDTLRNAARLGRHAYGGKFDLVHSFSRIAYLTPVLPLPLPKLMTYQRQISPKTTRLAVALSRGTLSFSAVSRQMIEAAPLAGQWTVVPNGVSLDAYRFRERVDETAPFIFLGRIEPIKGPGLAIAVARELNAGLVIAGNVPPEHRAWFESEIAPHCDGRVIRYAGPVDDVQKNELLGRARALLMPVRWDEPFGIVMIEAMACGTPVIGLRRGAVPEVVVDGHTGFVADTLDGMIAAARRLGEIGRVACRERVQQCYSDVKIAEAYLALYDAMIAHRPAGTS